MNILIDMNLSPNWRPFLAGHGFQAEHWSATGDLSAPDQVLLEWAKQNNHVVFTHDLDFGAILAATNAHAPSVLQIRHQNPMPELVGDIVCMALARFGDVLNRGALVTVDARSMRARILPILG